MPPKRKLTLDETIEALEEGNRLKREYRMAFFTPYPKQQEFFDLGVAKRERLLMAGNQLGKALKHGTLVATPKGWRAIEELRYGDAVIAGDGSVTRVTGVFPQGEVDLFAMSFDGEHEVVACGEHRWLYLPPKGRWPTRHSHGKIEANPAYGVMEVSTTRDLQRYSGGRPKQRPIIPCSQAFDLPVADLPIDPYVLGALLGDGSFRGGAVSFTTADAEMVEAIAAHEPIRARGQKYAFALLGLQPRLRALGLMGHLSQDKFIPDIYLCAGAAQRLALFQGLMDTDGSISADGSMEFCTTSHALADGVEWLAISLGMKCARRWRQTRDQNGNGLPSWRLKFRNNAVCPFRLQRKRSRWLPPRLTRDWSLWSTRPAGRGHATCISVAHPSHTYVIEHGIVTHNTEAGAFEMTCHLTGLYPSWWLGKRFPKAPRAWICGETALLVRDVQQKKLCGTPGVTADFGTGMIPKELFVDKPSLARGVTDAYDTIQVKHATGGIATATFKSYEQGRTKFQGEPVDVIWDDEEPDLEIYSECLTRITATKGIVFVTFTPLKGRSQVVTRYLDEKSEDRAVVTMTIEDAQHIPPEERAKIIAGYPAHEREARARGVPMLGSGRIYPVSEETIVEDTLSYVPPHWFKIWGIDFGIDHPFAAALLAWDKDADQVHILHTIRMKDGQPINHAAAMKAIGAAVPVAWPHDGHNRDKGSGEALARLYKLQGLLMLPDHAKDVNGVYSREAAVMESHDRMTTGRYKVGRQLSDWLQEFRLYHRKDGLIVRVDDDLMSATEKALIAKRFAKQVPLGNRVPMRVTGPVQNRVDEEYWGI